MSLWCSAPRTVPTWTLSKPFFWLISLQRALLLPPSPVCGFWQRGKRSRTACLGGEWREGGHVVSVRLIKVHSAAEH